MNKITLTYDDETEPCTVTVHSFSAIDEEGDIVIFFEMEERDYSNGGNGREFRLSHVQYPEASTYESEIETLHSLGIEAEHELINLAKALLSKDTTRKAL